MKWNQMIYNQHYRGILILILITSILASAVLAGPVSDKDITFQVQIPKETLSKGEWRIYLVSIGEFEKDNWKFDNYSNTIQTKYINFKKACGKNDTFYETLYKMSDEESKHKGCVVNGTYQEVYCFKTATDNKLCSDLIPYKINDNYNLDFGTYYNSYMWDINRAEFYNHFELSYCIVNNNSCTFKIHKSASPYNPYMIILEKLNSNEEIYFSNNTNITQTNLFYNESLFACEEPGCDVNIDVNLTLLKFEIEKPHRLVIGFNNKTYIDNQSSAKNTTIMTKAIDKEKNRAFYKILTWWRTLFA
jgi:hypothetical protein